jgi:hypothetical protein
MKRFALGTMMAVTAMAVTAGMAIIAGTPALADYYDGLRAYDAGKYQQAAKEWEKAANMRDAKSLLELGKLYREGIGVPQSFVKAHVYFNLAGSLGLAEAHRSRDEIAKRMSDAERARAQLMAEKWPDRENKSTAQGPQKPDVADPKKAAQGSWRWHISATPGTSCESLGFGLLNIANGKAKSRVTHPQDGPFFLQGDLYDSCKISMSAAGGHGSLSVVGMVEGNEGKGKIEVSGEVNCTGEWTIEKLK